MKILFEPNLNKTIEKPKSESRNRKSKLNSKAQIESENRKPNMQKEAKIWIVIKKPNILPKFGFFEAYLVPSTFKT